MGNPVVAKEETDDGKEYSERMVRLTSQIEAGNCTLRRGYASKELADAARDRALSFLEEVEKEVAELCLGELSRVEENEGRPVNFDWEIERMWKSLRSAVAEVEEAAEEATGQELARCWDGRVWRHRDSRGKFCYHKEDLVDEVVDIGEMEEFYEQGRRCAWGTITTVDDGEDGREV